MIYLKFFKNAFIVFLLIILAGCTKFAREGEVIKFINEKIEIEIDTLESFKLFILQDQICGACTNSVLSFVYSLDHDNSIIVISKDSKLLIKQLSDNIGESKVYVDKQRFIDKYGLRFAKDLVLSYNYGKLQYWSFLEEKKFNTIRDYLNKCE